MLHLFDLRLGGEGEDRLVEEVSVLEEEEGHKEDAEQGDECTAQEVKESREDASNSVKSYEVLDLGGEEGGSTLIGEIKASRERVGSGKPLSNGASYLLRVERAKYFRFSCNKRPKHPQYNSP